MQSATEQGDLAEITRGLRMRVRRSPGLWRPTLVQIHIAAASRGSQGESGRHRPVPHREAEGEESEGEGKRTNHVQPRRGH